MQMCSYWHALENMYVYIGKESLSRTERRVGSSAVRDSATIWKRNTRARTQPIALALSLGDSLALVVVSRLHSLRVYCALALSLRHALSKTPGKHLAS